MSPPVPVSLPAGTTSLPPLGGRLLPAYRIIWWLILAAALAAVAFSWVSPEATLAILALRLTKSAVLIAVSALLFRRRQRDPVAAMLSLAFLLWTISSSIDFASATGWPALIDRFRFLLFALALLFFPDRGLSGSWIRPIAAIIMTTFLLGCAEAAGVLRTALFLPIAIGCVVATLIVLGARYRSIGEGAERQQLKWVTLGLVVGIALILSARAGSALTAGMTMPIIASVVLEAMFQLGIIVLAFGFLISLLRYRLYDAEAAISRSAVFAALTLSIVGIFAACEALIELLGQRYLGSNIGSISGSVAAAVAAVLLTPIHGRITRWAEQRFQHDLAILKEELPELLAVLSAGTSVKQLADSVLPRIEVAVHATRMALLVDGKFSAAQGIATGPAQQLLRDWEPPESALIVRDEQQAFPLQVALRCPLGSIRAWLLLGPRPDGSFYGRDDLDALTHIAQPLQRTLFLVAEREEVERRRQRRDRRIKQTIEAMEERLAQLEAKPRAA